MLFRGYDWINHGMVDVDPEVFECPELIWCSHWFTYDIEYDTDGTMELEGQFMLQFEYGGRIYIINRIISDVMWCDDDWEYDEEGHLECMRSK